MQVVPVTDADLAKAGLDKPLTKVVAKGGGYFLDMSTGMVINGKKHWMKTATSCSQWCSFVCCAGKLKHEYFSDPTTSISYENTGGHCCLGLCFCCNKEHKILVKIGVKSYGGLEKYKEPSTCCGCCSKKEIQYMEKASNDMLLLTCCLPKNELRQYYVPSVSIRNANGDIVYEMRVQVPYQPKGCCSGGEPPCACCVRCINGCWIGCNTVRKLPCCACCSKPANKEFYVIAQPIYKPGQQKAVGYLNKTFRQGTLVGVILDVPGASHEDLFLLSGLAYAVDQMNGYHFESGSDSQLFLERRDMDFPEFLEIVGAPNDEEMAR